jgi:coproporphyrinogen III oxidase-like Fe-S oxidoreductase
MSLREALVERMQRPQRHRLLQGFPAVPAMRKAGPAAQIEGALTGFRRWLDGSLRDRGYQTAHEVKTELERDPSSRAEIHGVPFHEQPAGKAILARGDLSEPAHFTVDRERALIVGVIPHTQCVPHKDACGFCTFPHDRPNNRQREQMVDDVLSNITHACEDPSLHGRDVEAIYLGGGTANLSTPEEIASIVGTLVCSLSITNAELTLEGAPHLFDRLLSSHLKNLARMPVAQRRISIGVQTFEPNYLRMMGRESFGDAELVRRLARRCASLSITTSCDLLFNLPGQERADMLRDVDTAVSFGLEQVCLYNLILYEGLGTPWANEREFIEAMPTNERACANWLALRERLIAHGYVQTTLTNFEREDVATSAKRFRYEAASFSVERTDGIGFGPLSLTTLVNATERRGIKLLRRKSNAAGEQWSADDLMFRYDEAGLKALFLTRGLAKTRLDARVYEGLFGSSLHGDLREPIEVLQREELLQTSDEGIALTPRGMFYADAAVSVLAMGLADASDGAGLHTKDLLSERYVAGQHYGGMG